MQSVLRGLLVCWLATSVAWAAQVRLGVLAWQGDEEASQQWSPLMAALARALPQHQFSLRHYDLEGMAQALEHKEVDFVLTNPGHYVTLEASHGLTRIASQAASLHMDPAQVVGSAVIVRSERQEMQRLTDLRGRRLAAVSPNAFGGYQVIWAELKKLGLDPERGALEVVFTGMPMSRVVEEVLAGRVDAGVVRGCLIERWERERGEKLPLRVLSARHDLTECQISSTLYPGWAFAAARDTPPELSREILLALLSLPPAPGGLSWSVPADYGPVHQMLRELEVGPYAFLRETTWPSLMRRYWPLAAALAGILLFLLLYSMHVKYLVRRRTRELTAALAERERLACRVREDQQQMEHLSRLSILGELAATLAHELNQPLATIANYAQSLLRRARDGALAPSALNQAAAEIAAEAERAAGILAGIRAFARKRAPTRSASDPVAIARMAIALFQGTQEHCPDIKLRVDPAAAGCRVYANAQQIQQVILNLLKNAADAQQENGSHEPLLVFITRSAHACSFEVADHGPGLAPAQLEHLFEAFYTTKADGLGLGLSVCKTIIEAHGGEMQARPRAPTGLAVSFTLPLAETTPAP